MKNVITDKVTLTLLYFKNKNNNFNLGLQNKFLVSLPCLWN